MMKIQYLIITLIIGSLTFCAKAQSFPADSITEKPVKNKRAWEFGVGGSLLQMTRFNLIDFYVKEDGGYILNTNKKDVLFGGNLYVARELNRFFYLDFQGTIGYTRDRLKTGKENRFLYMGGLGLQWRLGEYFNSKYIDPFFRVGGNYMYKEFDIVYNGTENVNGDDVKWILENNYNKDGKDKKHLTPISLGAGVNMWLNDRFGIGLQGDYLLMPHKNVANVWQGSVRLLWRFGGESKKNQPVIQYVEIEKIVEKPTVVEKIVEVKVPAATDVLCELFNNIYFEFDKSDLTPESSEVIDKIAEIMKQDTGKKYLITGFTDIKGSPSYNIGLSQRRAKKVVDALEERGVSKTILKSRGVGSRISYATEKVSDQIRMGDRKVTIEIITNQDYWDYMPKNDL